MYQLRVVVAGVSPLIWRRLLVSATTTIAELHAVLRAAFGWSGQNPAPLRHSRPEYGISYVGGPGFRDDAHRVALTDLGLRTTERFAYHYDFTDDWRLECGSKTSWRPRLIGATRAAPVGGPGGGLRRGVGVP